jgi:DNA-binding transcriptional MerR regulator
MSGRSYLSIGDVLTLLRQEFQDITISKIRFLESQGLVNPERTPSGYRKFYDHDVERLRWVLRQQREHFLPLKVIKDRLDDGSADTGSEDARPAGGSRTAKVGGRRPRHDADGVDGRDEVPAGDPVLVGQRIGAGDEARATSVGSHPAGEGPGLPGLGSAGDRTAETGGPVAAGPSRTPDRSALSPRRRPSDRAPLLELVNEATGPRASTPDPANGTGDSATAGTETHAAASGAGGATGTAASRSASAGASSGHTSGEVTATSEPRAPRAPKGGRAPVAVSPPDPSAVAPTSTAETPPSRSPEAGAGAGAVSLSAEELAAAAELEVDVVRELQEYGLLVPSLVAGVEYFDEEALVVATVAGRFTRFGIEPRHLRLYKNAAEREAGFVEQVVLPLVRQRNPDARARAHETADELTQLGQQLRSSLLRNALGNLLNG